MEDLAAMHRPAESNAAQAQSEKVKTEEQCMQAKEEHENKAQDGIAEERRYHQRSEAGPMELQEPTQRPTQSMQEPGGEKEEIKNVMDEVRSVQQMDKKEDNSKMDSIPLSEAAQGAVQQVKAANKDDMDGEQSIEYKEGWNWEQMKVTCEDQSLTYDTEETFEVVGKADKANRRFDATIFKNKSTWIYQNVVFRFNDVTVYEYTERWRLGNKKENDSFDPIWIPTLDGKPYQTGKTDFFAMMWQCKEPTDLDDRNWTQSRDKKLISGDLQCKKGTMRIPARWEKHTP